MPRHRLQEVDIPLGDHEAGDFDPAESRPALLEGAHGIIESQAA